MTASPHPASLDERRRRVQLTVQALRDPDTGAADAELWQELPNGRLYASTSGVIAAQALLDGALPGHSWRRLPHLPSGDDTDDLPAEYYQGDRFLIAGPTGEPSADAPIAAMQWLGLWTTRHGVLLPVREFHPSLPQLLQEHQTEELVLAPLDLIHHAFFRSMRHPDEAKRIHPLRHFADVLERLLESPEHHIWAKQP